MFDVDPVYPRQEGLPCKSTSGSNGSYSSSLRLRVSNRACDCQHDPITK